MKLFGNLEVQTKFCMQELQNFNLQTMGEEVEEIFVKPTMSEKKIVTLSKLSAITFLNVNFEVV